MPIKVLEIDLSQELSPIPITAPYNSLRILVRAKGQPIGWVSIPSTKKSYIPISKLNREIQRQVSWQAVSEAFANSFNMKNEGLASSEPISVIVCTRNRTKSLHTCLHSLLKLNYDNYEIIVVDNASDSQETYELTRNFNVRYVYENRPGLDWARNRGIKEAKYDLVAFTDDDVRVDPYWLQAIGNEFSIPQVMAVTGYVAPAQLDTTAQRLFELDYGGMGHGFYRRVISNKHMSEQDIIRSSNFGIGANMAFRKEVFNRVGNFDVALDVGTPSSGGGDIEIFHRLVTNGEMLVYEPSVLVWHYHRESYTGLKKQIFNNGRSFGCYLITCFRKSNVRKKHIIKFLIITWFYRWNFRNLVKSRLPKAFTLLELYGMLTSPIAYAKSKAHARKVAAQNFQNIKI